MTIVAGKLPTAADEARWRSADTAARPRRLELLRERMAREGVGAYFGVRREHIRYLTGLELAPGEEHDGNTGQFLVSADDLVVLADSRYFIQVLEQCPDARMEKVYNDFFERWPNLLASIGSPKRVQLSPPSWLTQTPPGKLASYPTSAA